MTAEIEDKLERLVEKTKQKTKFIDRRGNLQRFRKVNTILSQVNISQSARIQTILKKLKTIPVSFSFQIDLYPDLKQNQKLLTICKHETIEQGVKKFKKEIVEQWHYPDGSLAFMSCTECFYFNSNFIIFEKNDKIKTFEMSSPVITKDVYERCMIFFGFDSRGKMVVNGQSNTYVMWDEWKFDIKTHAVQKIGNPANSTNKSEKFEQKIAKNFKLIY